MSSEREIDIFLKKYSEVIALQISAVQADVEASAEAIMSAIRLLTEATVKHKINAENLLEKTCLNGDASSAVAIDLAQKYADQIIVNADAAKIENDDLLAIANDARQMVSVFMRRTEALALVDDLLHEILLKMAGCLSNADVMKQRLDHIRDIFHSMNNVLSALVEDSGRSITGDAVIGLKESLLDDAYSRYTVENERSEFKRVFGPPPRVLKAYVKSRPA